jgi:hypothetical protein
MALNFGASIARATAKMAVVVHAHIFSPYEGTDFASDVLMMQIRSGLAGG